MDGPHMVAMGVESMICYWRELLELLPPWLREPVDGGGLDKQVREIRLHLGQPPLLAAGGEEYFPSCRRVGTEDLSYAVNTASRFSAYAAWSIAQGYLTARGGHRLGLCGTAIVREGKMSGMKELRSVCIRVARDFPGLAAGLPDRLGTGSALILGPPGAGKTTLLRDLIRQISDGKGEAVAVADQRGELFPALYQGYQFQTGSRTDVLTGASKAEGMELLLRSMGPKWIAVDEITALEDCAAMEQCSYCGVRFLATAHAWSVEDLHRRPVYRRLLQTGMFQTAVVLQPDQTYTVEELHTG